MALTPASARIDMRACQRCGASLEGRWITTKWCGDCSDIVRGQRKRARKADIAAAYARTVPASSVVRVPRTCQFPGCTTDLSHKPANTIWCPSCRLKMDQSRSARRHGKAARQAIDPFLRRVSHVVSNDGPPRTPNVLACRECCDMPWARAEDRSNTRSGDSCGRNPVGVNGRCKGCGKPWGPEPPVNLGSAMRSNMGPTVVSGRLYGGEATRNAYAQPTGHRKGAKR